MNFSPLLTLAGPLLLEPQIYEDERGFFAETYRISDHALEGIPPFVQENLSCSNKNVLRGLHYQLPNAQGKLIQLITGSVFDVIIDLRKASPTFGKWRGIELSAATHLQLWIPPGFAHGFYVTLAPANILYKTTEYYNRDSEHTLHWNDPQINICWPIQPGESPRLSPKDQNGLSFDDLISKDLCF